MNTTEWRLYNFLKDQAEIDPNRYITQEEICEALPDLFKMNHLAMKKHCCSTIQIHVIKINQSSEIEKIILYKNQTYKLAANREEADEFLKKKLYNKALRLLYRYSILNDKVNSDGQGKIISNKDHVIDAESKARNYVETYVKKEKV